jgi:hypothetical protein
MSSEIDSEHSYYANKLDLGSQYDKSSFISDTKKDAKIEYKLNFKKGVSNMSIDRLNQRPNREKLSNKSNKSYSKSNHQSLHKNSKRESKKNSDDNSYKEKRKLSLPDISRHKLKKKSSKSQYSNQEVAKSNSSYSNKNLQVKNANIGQSFMSFNAPNSNSKNNTSIVPQSQGNNLIDKTHFSGYFTENNPNNLVRESFESCTTEGKKTSNIKTPSTPMENAYGAIESEGLDEREMTEENKQSRRSNKVSVSGDGSLPDINNSVVEDSLPFIGLDNHHKVISKEGFSGANDTNYMKKTNENFYSSFKQKRTDNGNVSYTAIPENGFPYVNQNSQNLNKSEIQDDGSDYEKLQPMTRDRGIKSISSSPPK